MPVVHVVNRGLKYKVARGATILKAAQNSEADWHWLCGGQALCGTCAVLVVEGALAQPSALEQYFIEGWGYHPAFRLACQAKVLGDVSVIACSDVGHDQQAALGLLIEAQSCKRHGRAAR